MPILVTNANRVMFILYIVNLSCECKKVVTDILANLMTENDLKKQRETKGTWALNGFAWEIAKCRYDFLAST